MRRLWILISLLVVTVAVGWGLLNGVLATRFFQPLLRQVENKSDYTLSVKRARLTWTGNIRLSQVVFGKIGAPLTTFSFIEINPRWRSWIKGQFDLDQVSASLGDGVLTGQGTVTQNPVSFRFQGTAERFPLDLLAQIKWDVPQQIRAAYTGPWECSGTALQWDGNIQGRLERGVSTSSPTLQVSCDLHFEGSQGTINFSLARDKSEICSQIKLDTEKETIKGDFKVRASPLSMFAPFWPELSQTEGTLVATGHLAGPWVALGGAIQLEGSGIRHKGFGVKKLEARFGRNGAQDQPFQLGVSGSSITWVSGKNKPNGLARAELKWEGTTRQGDLTFDVLAEKGVRLKGQGPAQRKQNSLAWSWKKLMLIFPSGEKYAAVPGGTVDLVLPKEIHVQNLAVGDQGQTFRIQRFSLAKETFAVEATADHFYLAIPAISASGRLSGSVSLGGPVNGPNGPFEFALTSGTVGNVKTISGALKGRVENGLISISEAEISNSSLPPLQARGTVPWAWITGAEVDRPMDIGFETDRLDPVALFKQIPVAKVGAGGFLQAHGRVFGLKNSISVEGTLAGSLPSLEWPARGISARETNIDIEIKDRRLSVRKAETRLGKGSLRISGGGELPSLNLDVEGTRVSLLIRRQLELLGDLQFHLGGTLSAPDLTGTLSLTEGTYEVSKKKDKEAPTIAGNGPFQRFWESLKMNVQAAWPNNVWYRDGLTKIETRADVDILKQAGESTPGLRGQVTLLKGNYDAYGRDFVLKTGELTFSDPSEINPQLNLQATHKMKDYRIELTVLGTAKKPDLQFQSTPPLQEQDILALLALGKVPGQSASQGSASAEGAPSEAAELAADVVSNYLTREIRSAGMNVLDLDVVRVSPSEKGNEWTVGRYWGSKLFLSYSYTPEDAANQVLKAEYSLTPRWTFVGQTGSQTDNYLDLTFRVPVGKSRHPKK